MLCKVLFLETEEFMLSLVKDSLEHTVVVLCISLGHPIQAPTPLYKESLQKESSVWYTTLHFISLSPQFPG